MTTQQVNALQAPAARGVGKPDYYLEAWSAKQRAGYALTYKQTLKIFGFACIPPRFGASPYPWVIAPLAPGSVTHMVDLATGLPMPFTCPAGYIIQMIEKTWNFDGPTNLWLWMDGFLAAAPGAGRAFEEKVENNVVNYSSAWFDPTATLPHTFDVQVEAQDPMNALVGGCTVTAILEEVGTPPLPSTKDVRCHWCGHINSGIPAHETRVTCGRCHKPIWLVDTEALVRRSS